MNSLLIFLLFFVTAEAAVAVPSLPLSTQGRYIVDGDGRRVKLACANWAAHLEPAAAEGLNRQPVDAVSARAAAMGFNCVRLTWPTYLLTRDSLRLRTVRASLESVGLPESVISGVEFNNPEMVNVTLLRAFQAVVESLAKNNLMVILDNQISKPGWCCSKLDGNGFFGDIYFDPDEWINGLMKMAKLFRNSPYVVGMSLRNELRGPRQNLTQWYRYMQRGAEAVHAGNPDLLVVLSGLDYDKDMSYLSQKQVLLSFKNKLVFELHWYGFSDGQDWANGQPNQVCESARSNFTMKGGFLLQQGWPLFLSEFGVDQSGSSLVDNRFLTCFLSVAAEFDFDWAYWPLQGSYYIRDGQVNYDETYGLLRWDWCEPRNSSFIRRISAIQSPLKGPGIHRTQIIFHPLTGLCVLDTMVIGRCNEAQGWVYNKANNRIQIAGMRNLCVEVQGIGEPARIGTDCSNSDSEWELISESKMQIATKYKNSFLCWDLSYDGLTVITNSCKCIGGNSTCDPERQWFKIVVTGEDRNGDLLPDVEEQGRISKLLVR